jgi:hypothetical protein
MLRRATELHQLLAERFAESSEVRDFGELLRKYRRNDDDHQDS